MIRNLFENTNTMNNTIILQETPVEAPKIILPNERQSTFAGIGSEVRSAITVEEALRLGNLNYQVEKKPIFLADGTPIEGRYATTRLSDNFVYDIVSERYNIVQNEDAFDFINYMSEDIQFEKVGETASGMIYLIASLEPMNILGDTYQPHLCFRNSHNGKFQLSVTICPLRIVCQNQFHICFKESPNTINIRHSRKAPEKLEEAAHILKGTADYMKELNIQAQKWANIHITNEQIEKVLFELFPIDKENMKDFQIERIEEQRIILKNIYNCNDNQNFKNTMWGMINAYSDFITHKPHRDTATAAENNFIAVTFDPNKMQNTLSLMNFISLVSRIAA